MSSYRASHMGEDRGAQYDATHANKVDAHIWDAFIKDLLRERLEACAAAGGTRYLDFACGTGRVLKVGAPFFESATGIDISEDMLVVARERNPEATIHCGDVTSGELDVEGSFDCVTLFRFLLNAEYELNIKVLEWLAAHMKPGAILIANNHMNTASFRGVATVLSNAILHTKHNQLSRRRCFEMLESSGFRLLNVYGYRVLPSFKGKPILGKSVQTTFERVLNGIGLGRLGAEQVIVAERL